MYFKRDLMLFSLLSFSIDFLYCEPQDFSYEIKEIIFKLRPLKNPQGDSCKEFCQNIVCQTIDECNEGALVKNASYCNCCDICVKYLDIGQPCKSIIKGSLALGGQSRCKPGTECKNGICELDPIVNSCLKQREFRRKIKGQRDYAEDIWIPQCDEEGKFEGKQKKIRKSICVDEFGKRIFGSAGDSPENTCACSRHMQKIKENDDISYNAKPQEHCDLSGNFDVIQCIDNLCYCADKTGQIKSHLVRIDSLDKLSCYDSKTHKKNYLKNCEIELQRTRKLSYEFWLKGVKLLGIDRIKCDPDGSYFPTQCLSDRCVCTDKEGKGIGSYAEVKGKIMKLNMTCNCARDEIHALLTSSFTCLGYGNYDNFTCFDNDCVCVDEDGDSISKELKKTEKEINSLCSELIDNLSKQTHEDDDGDYDYDYASNLDLNNR